MRQLLLLFIFLVSVSCIRETPDELPDEEILGEKPKKEFHPCHFDLRDREGDFSLEGKWEFIDFQDIQTGNLKYWMCTGRIANLYFKGGDSTKVHRFILDLQEDAADPDKPACTNQNRFETEGFLTKVSGCYNNKEEPLLEMTITEKIKNPDLVIITHEEEGSDKDYFSGLEDAIYYEIEKNKLYIYTSDDKNRMLFLAIEE